MRRLLFALPAVVLAASPALAARPQPPAPVAGPQMTYSDQADDAYRVEIAGESRQGVVPNPALSNPAFDILSVGFAPVPSGRKGAGGGYSAMLTVKGVARTDGSYVSEGDFTNSGGEACQVYHFLRPGIRAFANVFCGVDDARRYVGQISGGPVTAASNSFGGTILSATFDNRSIPAELEAAGRTMSPLKAFTCVSGDEGLGCRPYEVLDDAHGHDAAGSYRI